MKTLLIATDFSSNAHAAAAYGYRLAQRINARLWLCHAMIIPAEIPLAGLAIWPESEFDELMQDSKERLIQLSQELEHRHELVPFKPEIGYTCVQGSVCSVLGAEARLQAADLIIMGAHGRDGLGTFLIGDHCRQMIAAAGRPLLIVPPHHKAETIKKIAFASDFKDPARDLTALRFLIELARSLGASVLLTHIYNDKQHSAAFLSWTKHLLIELIDRSGYGEIDYLVVEDRRVEDGLEALAAHEKIDLMAMAHRDHSWIHQLLQGSHSQKMAAQQTVPLLIFPDNQPQ